ncbi:MAG: glycine cleavage system protein T, partial [Planctomycetaceae bacterium]
MSEAVKTILYDKHLAAGAKMVEFGGYLMPIQYPKGIVEEHLLCRKKAGLFDVSHMGRFIFSGKDAVRFLQHVLTNNAAALSVGQSQYTMIQNDSGGAVDDAYLYRFFEHEYLLVVNAANRAKDWAYFTKLKAGFDVEMIDRSEELAMISVQGPLSRDIIGGMIQEGHLPQPMRNALSWVIIDGVKVWVARTGYTGEPLCFELFAPNEIAGKLWDALRQRGARPVGLGARDTLRLEAGLPLYGHELGVDVEGKEIPIFA